MTAGRQTRTSSEPANQQGHTTRSEPQKYWYNEPEFVSCRDKLRTLCAKNTHCVSGALHEKSYAGFLVAVGAAVGPLQWQHTKFLFQMKTLILGHLQNALCVMRRHLLLFVLSDGTRLLRPCVCVCVAATTKQRINYGQVMKTILPNDYWHLQNKFEDSFTHQL